tara:strand:- start:25855 stop:26436 length:582 start_codon:yes stop_codon:yes gene_type:complete
MIRSKLFNEVHFEWISEAYKKYTLHEVTDRFNCKFDKDFKPSQINNFIRNNSIKSGRSGKFASGHTPWTKGTKGVVKAGSSAFKKGIIPHNTLPVGSERINKDGHLEIKLETGWVTKQRHAWKENNGPIPKNHFVRFIDGVCLNCDIDNLFLVNAAENLQLNKMKYSAQPEALKESTLLIAKIIAKTHALGKV